MNDHHHTPERQPVSPIWLVAPESENGAQRRALFERLYQIFRRLGLRAVLRGLRMCLLYEAARRVQLIAVRLLARDETDTMVHLSDIFALWLLKVLPGAYLRLFRLLIGRGEWVLYYHTLAPGEWPEE